MVPDSLRIINRPEEIEARLVPVYLLHRYQTAAVARLLGGATYGYSLAGT